MVENSSEEVVLSEDELYTIVLVDEYDTVVGSVAPDELYTGADQTKTTTRLHRTASLYIVSNDRLLVTTKSLGGNTFVSGSLATTPYFGMTPPEVVSAAPEVTPEAVENGGPSATTRLTFESSPTPADVTGARNALFRNWKEEYRGESCADGTRLPPPPAATNESFQFLGRVHHSQEIEYVFLYALDDSVAVDTPLWEAPTLTSLVSSSSTQHWMSWTQLKQLISEGGTAEAFESKVTLVSPDSRLFTVVSWLSELSADASPWTRLTGGTYIVPNLHQILDANALPPFQPREQLSTPALHDTSKKQGAYGKIVTHKESKLKQLMRIDEVWAALTYLYISPLPSNLVVDDPDVAFCEEILVAVSRSFAAVIRQLPAVLIKDVAIFYLVLRALDTVEDDMTAFPNNAIKIQHLLNFHNTALGDPTWRMDGVGQADEKRLLQEFPAVHRVFASLEPHSQEVIRDITFRMATGMAEFIGKDLGQGTIDVTEYNRYCHFVAGLVGEGLSRLFSLSTLEDDSLTRDFRLSDRMGMFLQKANIIRDFLEDYVDQRAFWPQSIWKKYSASGDLGYFCDVEKDPAVKLVALQCLNELVADALELVPDCLAYMSSLQCTEVFRFCAIPQVMAVATLEKCYNNPQVFTGVVKIRKGLSCQLIQRSNSVAELHETFYTFVERIQTRCQKETVATENADVYARTMQACSTALNLTRTKAMEQRRARQIVQLSVLAACAVISLVLSMLRFGAFPTTLVATPDDRSFVAVMRAVLIIVVVSWLGRFVGPWTAVRSKSTLKTADLLMGRTVV